MNEVYVAAIDRPGKQRVSSGGGLEPVWRPDGKELYFLSDESLMTAEVKGSGESVTFGTPQAYATSVKREDLQKSAVLKHFAGRQAIPVALPVCGRQEALRYGRDRLARHDEISGSPG